MKHLSEADVVRLWQRSLLKRRHLTDSEGGPVEIVYPGRLNDSRGGDFREAVVAAGNENKSGCIELHTLSSGWQAHGHHRDPVYNQVVLHVAMESVSGRVARTVLENGKTIPTVILSNNILAEIPGVIPEPAGLPCSGAGLKLNPETLVEYLERAGGWRLEAKAGRYQAELMQIGAEESFYQGFLEALGYTKNQLPFRELSRRVPLRDIARLIDAASDEESCLISLQALWLGSAGLLPSQRFPQSASDEYILKLERIWRTLNRSLTMSYRDWELFKVRPGNYPVRRLAALSYLLYRYRERGWLPALLDLVRHVPVDKCRAGLESALMVAVEGYWANHYDFGLYNPAINPVLLGPQRAAEIIINIFLPFTLAWSQMREELGLALRAREIYQQYPRLETNSIERHMFQQLSLNSRQVNSACRQQGLIQIYKTLCTQGKCAECAIAV